MQALKGMDEKCPWPKGNHLEEHFPCGSKCIDIDKDEHIHSHVPGHILVQFIRWKESMFEPELRIRFKNGEGARRTLIELLERKEWMKPWTKAHHRYQIKACIDCTRTNWDNFAFKINERLDELSLTK